MRQAVLLAFSMAIFLANVHAQQPTVKQCRADLARWNSMFKSAYAVAACQGDDTSGCAFVPPVRGLRTKQFADLALQADTCKKVDHKDSYLYQKVASAAENMIVMRAGTFIQATGQSDDYNRWEQSRMNPHSAPPEEDQYSQIDHPRDVRIMAVRKMYSEIR